MQYGSVLFWRGLFT